MRCMSFVVSCLMFVVLGLSGAQSVKAAGGDWTYEVAPYFWGAGLDGTVQIGGLPAAEVDAGFSDVWDSLETGFAMFGVARNNDWVVFADVNYLDTRVTERLPQRTVNLDNESFVGMVALGQQSQWLGQEAQAEAYIGLRYYHFDTELGISGLGSRSASEDWVDPLVGINLAWPFANGWRISLLADIGGFTVGSDLAWQVMPIVHYQFNPTWSGKLAYRWLDVDYEDSDYTSNLLTHGWMAGIGFCF